MAWLTYGAKNATVQHAGVLVHCFPQNSSIQVPGCATAKDAQSCHLIMRLEASQRAEWGLSCV